MYMPKTDDDSNPYRDYRKEKPRGILFKLAFGYIPAAILFLAIRILMLHSGVSIVSLGAIDDRIRDLFHFLKNWYTLNFG